MPVPPIYGGAVEKLWFALGQEFANAGHHVTHISKKDKSLPFNQVINGVNHIRLKSFSAHKNPFVSKIFDFIYSLRAYHILPQADIIISNTFFFPFFRVERTKGIVIASVERMPKGQLRFYKTSVHYRANSRIVQQAILSEIPSAVSRTILVPNPLPELHNEGYSEIQHDRIILYVGRIHPEKGINILLESFRHLSKLLKNGYRLRIIGPSQFSLGGGGDSYLQEMKNRFSDVEGIEWVGGVFDDKILAKEYQNASIFVYPSIAETGETFGLAPLESMAYGCIPIVSDLNCFKDFISDGNNGFAFNHRQNAVINLTHKIINVIDLNKEHLDTMRKEALKVRVSHSKELASDILLKYFKKISVAS